MAFRSNCFNGSITALLVLCVAACAAAPRELRIPPPLDDASLGAGDLFAIRVTGQPTLSGEFRVEGDGTFQYPYLGRLPAAGLDAPGIERVLHERLVAQRLVLAPQIAVSVLGADSRDLAVLGEVVRPGRFHAEPGMTVVRAIVAAGGFTDRADSTLLLTRHTRDGVRVFAIAVDAIRAGRLADVPLGPRDVVMVTTRPGTQPYWQR